MNNLATIPGTLIRSLSYDARTICRLARETRRASKVRRVKWFNWSRVDRLDVACDGAGCALAGHTLDGREIVYIRR